MFPSGLIKIDLLAIPLEILIGVPPIKNQIFFDLEKNIGSNEFTISNVRINNPNNTKNSDKQFFIKNITVSSNETPITFLCEQ